MPGMSVLGAVIVWSLLYAKSLNGKLQSLNNLCIVNSVVTMYCMHADQVITKHPLPLLLQVNNTGDFSCICSGSMRCSLGHWVINTSHLEFNVYNDAYRTLGDKGFTFPEPVKNGSQYTYELSVNASEAINNTVIHCNFEQQGDSNDSVVSMDAVLLVISSK